jgi:acyl carrier protein
MEKRNFLLLLDDLFELEPGTVKESDALLDLEGWNSLAVIGFMALVDEHFGVHVPAKQLASCRTVSDLMKFPGNQLFENS